MTHLNLTGPSQICRIYFPVLRHLLTDDKFFGTFPVLTHLTNTTSRMVITHAIDGIYLPVLKYLSTDCTLCNDFPMLTHLTYENYNCSPFESALFPVLTHLIFGKDYNRDLSSLSNYERNVQPNKKSFPSLTHLTFGDNFNKNFDIRIFPYSHI